ncbi:MAG TPA: hypothetical protein VGS08_06140, partial [Candidatus Saccharimonadales bacterium]|nr:hypothetical protein [Candidatus Saccharimonadales bacterium]
NIVHGICCLRPRLIFVENVAAIRKRGLDRVLGDLAELGYDAVWTSLSSTAQNPGPPPSLKVFTRNQPPRAQIVGENRSSYGVVLAKHWYTPHNEVLNTVPVQGDVVRWPAAVPVTGKDITFRLLAHIPPTRIEIHQFTGRVDKNGIPANPGTVVNCKAKARASACWFSNGSPTRIELRPSSHKERLVLYAEWYVPIKLRPAATRLNPVVSASWGFIIKE